MRKILLLLAFCLCLNAQSDKTSSIPIPKNTFLNLDAQECDKECLKYLLKEKKYFSFLSKHRQQNDEKLDQEYQKLNAMFSIASQQFTTQNQNNAKIQIALLLPQKIIQRYAISITNSVTAYLLSKNIDFDIEVFNCNDENDISLQNSLNEIKNRQYTFIIAALTPKGANYVAKNSGGLTIFIPTINYKQVNYPPENILFGGIDYAEQIQKLLKYTNPKIAIFSDGSNLSEQLNSWVRQYSNVLYEQQIIDQNTNFKQTLKGNRILQNASIFLNMPLVKATLLSSQLRVYNIKAYKLLSTQINYHPMLLSIAQSADTKSLLLANSIGKSPLHIQINNALFNHSIVYDWVNYATNVGLDFIYTQLFPSYPREFQEQIDGNQIMYNTDIYKVANSRFYKLN